MRIAGLARRLGRPGGAEESLQTFLANLSTDHRTMVFGHASRDPHRDSISTKRILATDLNLPATVRVPMAYLEFYLRFKRQLERFQPSIVFAQHELALLGARYDAPQVLFLRDESLLPSAPYERGSRRAVVNPAAHAVQERLFTEVIHGSDLLVANSEHTAKKYAQHWGVNPKVVYPFVDVSSFEVETTGEKILHVTPTLNKGIDVTLDVAEQLSNETFLIVGQEPPTDVRTRIRDRSNVEYRGYVDDMRDVYRETKLVLMPSRWDEPFGRVPLESGISGIPVLCSGSGGLREAVGDDDLIVDSNNPAAYVQAIESVLSDYDTYAERVRRNALAKSAPKQITKLKDIVERCLAVEL